MNTELKIWKYTWNDVLSDTEFRKFMVQSQTGLIDVTYITKNVVKVQLPKHMFKKGTIYISSLLNDEDEDAHFLSYEIVGKHFIIHDPAHLNVAFSGWLSKNVVNALEKNLPTFTVEISKVHPQRCNWDTFCQTWSLAKLMGFELHHVTKNSSRRELYKIIKKIAASKDFEEYVKFNKDWVEKCIKSHGRSNDLKTAQDFIKYSRRLSFKNFQAFR